MAGKMRKILKEKVNKKIPTVLPSGFIIRVNERNITMLDFIDIDYEDKANVIGSYYQRIP